MEIKSGEDGWLTVSNHFINSTLQNHTANITIKAGEQVRHTGMYLLGREVSADHRYMTLQMEHFRALIAAQQVAAVVTHTAVVLGRVRRVMFGVEVVRIDLLATWMDEALQ